MKTRVLPPLLAIVVLAASCGRGTDADSGATWEPPEGEIRAVAVETSAVELGRLVDGVRGAGIVEGAREAWVVSRTEGLVIAEGAGLGERVAGGDVLLRVDDALAARRLESAEQRFATASLEFEAAESSLANGSLSELQHSRIRDALLAAEADLAASREAFDDTRVRAPFDGVVAQKDRSFGLGNTLSRGARVARIVDDSSFRTEISVGEGQVLLIAEGDPAEVRGSDGVLREGSVEAVSAGSDGGTGSYAVLVAWEGDDGDPLRSGMAVDVEIPVTVGVERPIVPASAVLVREGRPFVYLDVEGAAVPREIRVGGRLGERLEVLSGLEGGESLVVSGLPSLAPGIPLDSTPAGGTLGGRR